MKLSWDVTRVESLLKQSVLVVFLAVTLELSGAQGKAAGNVVIWDSCLRFTDTVDTGNRNGWKVVPGDLLLLEADPAKASSDPGYYGREYTFQGDAVIENGCLTAVFWSRRGRIAVYSKAAPSRKIVEIVPLQMKTGPAEISNCGILQNTGADASLEISFSAAGVPDLSIVISIGRSEIVEIRAAQNINGISLLSPIEYGVAPSFIGDDLIYDAKQYPSAKALCIPSQNLFLGLLEGQDSVLVLTWPQGNQQMKLGLADREQPGRFIESVDFENDGQSLYMAVLEAPGIWHREELKPSFLEKDVPIDWKRPFTAKWITQLYEGRVRTTFAFRESKGQIWRGVAGMYCYPVWFDGDKTFYHLSKKVPPKGESIVYCLEGKGTPGSISTPVDIMKAALGRQACDGIIDLAGQRLRTHHRRGAAGIRRACTCGCTEVIEAVFKAGQETDRSEYIEESVGDMVYFVRRHLERIDEYRAFADDLIRFLRVKAGSNAECKPFLEGLEQMVQQIPQAYDAQKQNIKSLEYADELARKTIALTKRHATQNLETCLYLCTEWRGMGGAQDGLLAQYHIIVRELFQEAGYGCADQPGALELAREIRLCCRQCLRNPDGYEIWPNY